MRQMPVLLYFVILNNTNAIRHHTFLNVYCTYLKICPPFCSIVSPSAILTAKLIKCVLKLAIMTLIKSNKG